MRELLLFGVLSTLVFQGEGLMCYNCTSYTITPGDPCDHRSLLHKGLLVECPPDRPYCQVQRTTATVMETRSTQYLRSCSDTVLNTCVSLRVFDAYTCFSTCDTDKCNTDNSSKRHLVTWWFLLLCFICTSISCS